jgi:hypothetical protein
LSLWTALAGIAFIQSDVLHPLFGIIGLLLAPLFVLGSLEFVGPFEVRGWKLAGTLVPLAYIGWSVWLLPSGSACYSPPASAPARAAERRVVPLRAHGSPRAPCLQSRQVRALTYFDTAWTHSPWAIPNLGTGQIVPAA